MFYNLLHHIKTNHKPVETFMKYNGMDWMNHVHTIPGQYYYTIYQNKKYHFGLFHWLSCYPPLRSSYTNHSSVHCKIVIGTCKLYTLPTDTSTYSVKIVDPTIRSYSHIPEYHYWVIKPTSKMLYMLQLTEY